MKRAIVASLLVCIVAVVATAGCLEDGGDTEAAATTMSMQEISSDYNQNMDRANGTITLWLASVDEGDTLVIKDTIDSLTYDDQNQTSVVTFTSTSQSRQQAPLRFDGDISDEFSEGDTVAVTTHIVNVTMTQQNPQTGQTITYHYETFEEGWDVDTERSVPFPQSTIEHAEDTNENDNGDTDDTGDDDTNDTEDISNATSITFYQYWNDYSRSRDNETQTIMAYLESFDEGDTVVIEDQLQNLTYNATESLTVIQFASYPLRLAVEGDITDEFQADDTVTLTSDIINTTFSQQLQGQEWTVHYETFADGWDTANNTETSFPQTALKHADEG